MKRLADKKAKAPQGNWYRTEVPFTKRMNPFPNRPCARCKGPVGENYITADDGRAVCPSCVALLVLTKGTSQAHTSQDQRVMR